MAAGASVPTRARVGMSPCPSRSRSVGRLGAGRPPVDHGAPAQLVAEEQVVGDGQVVDEVELLVDGGHAPGQGRGRIARGQGSAVDDDLAGGGGDEPGDALDERGLAGAVLADEAVHLPGLDGEVDAVERPHPGVVLDQPAHGEQGPAALVPVLGRLGHADTRAEGGASRASMAPGDRICSTTVTAQPTMPARSSSLLPASWRCCVARAVERR